MVCVNSHQILLILSEMLRCVKIGEKIKERLDEMIATWGNHQPLRLMFQDEARFGRVSDTHRCECPPSPMCQDTFRRS